MLDPVAAAVPPEVTAVEEADEALGPVVGAGSVVAGADAFLTRLTVFTVFTVLVVFAAFAAVVALADAADIGVAAGAAISDAATIGAASTRSR